MVRMTLPVDSNDRKNYAVFRGCLRYFPAALAGVSKTSKLGNDKHNLGQEMHHARNKSQDHGDCILRHLMDVEDLLAAHSRGEDVKVEEILIEIDSMAWRALALSQSIHEAFGAPLAPGAKVEKTPAKPVLVEEPIVETKLVPKIKFPKGETVRHTHNDTEVTVEGTYFTEKGDPVLFVRDTENNIFAVDQNFYKSIYAETKKGS